MRKWEIGMNQLLRSLRKYPIIYQMIRNVYYFLFIKPYCNIILIFYYLRIGLISKGILKEDARYKKILELKGKHYGKRCFIVATGPSVKMEDLEQIKNEITISMNSIVNVLNDTSYRPTYYMVQDYGTLKKIYQNIKKLPSQTIKLVGVSNLNTHEYKSIIENDQDMGLYRLNTAKIIKNGNHVIAKTNVHFSWDCWKEIMDGYTVTYSAIQLAVWMGIREIYLLGCDCNYSQKINHIGEYIGENHEYSDKTVDRMIRSYECACNHLKEKVKIYNATRGGQLEIFPRVDLDTLFNQDKQNDEK